MPRKMEDGNADGISRIPIATVNGTFMQRLALEQEKDKWIQDMNPEIGGTKNNYTCDEDGLVWSGQGKDARLAIPATKREEILEANHDYILANHGGIGKTYAKTNQSLQQMSSVHQEG